MLTNSPAGHVLFSEALSKTLIHKGVFERSELVHQLEDIRSDSKARPPAEQAQVAAEVDMMITRVNSF